MGLYGDVLDFLVRHRGHGALTSEASPVTVRGYQLTIACACGVAFERWVTPTDAVRELVRTNLLAIAN